MKLKLAEGLIIEALGCVLGDEHQRGADILSEVMVLTPDNPKAIYGHGMALLKMKRFADAITDFNAALALMDDGLEKANVLIFEAQAYAGIGDRFDDELRCNEQAINVAPDSHIGRVSLAKCYASHDMVIKCIKEWGKVIEQFPDQAHDGYLVLAEIHNTRGEYKKAETLLDKALEEYPDSRSLRLARIDLYEDIGEDEKELADLEYLRERDPDDDEITRELATEYGYSGNLIRAEGLMQKLVKRDKHNPDNYETLANIYMTIYESKNEKSYIAKAIEYYSKAISLSSNSRDEKEAELYYERGHAYWMRKHINDETKARQDWRIAALYNSDNAQRLFEDHRFSPDWLFGENSKQTSNQPQGRD